MSGAPPDRLPVPLALAATLGSGVLYALCFPTASYRALAWIALVPFLLAVRGGSVRRAIGLGALLMLTLAYGVNDWFPRAVSTYYLQPRWVGYGFFVGVTLLTAAPATMLFAVCYRALARQPRAWLPLAAAAAWVAGELMRTRLLGDPWVLFGYSQVDARLVVQVADLAGVYGIGFLLVAVNAAVADVLWALGRRAGTLRPALRGTAAVACVIAAAVGYGSLRLRTLAAGATAADRRVAVVQANLDLGSQWRPEFYGRNLERHLRLTWDVLRAHEAHLVVWPESATTFFLADEPAYRASIARVLAPARAELLAGGPYRDARQPDAYHNSAFLLDARGAVRGRYDKQRLLPFAEYFPLPQLDFLRREFGRVREFTPGGPARLLETSIGRAGIVICNEAVFAAPARARVRAGAEVLVSLANDSWVGEPKYAAQAFQKTRLRAVEQRRWLVRASTSGPSAVVDPAGRVHARGDFRAAETIAARVTPRREVTLYARAGDTFAVLCALVALAAWLAVRRP